MKEQETQSVNTSILSSHSSEADKCNRTSEGLFFETFQYNTTVSKPGMMEQPVSLPAAGNFCIPEWRLNAVENNEIIAYLKK